MKNIKVTMSVLFLFLLSVLFSCHAYASPKYQWVKVLRALDGESIKILTEEGMIETVKLIGVDAPISVDYLPDVNTVDQSVFLDGIKAKEYLENLVGKKEVRLEFEETIKDEKGDKLAYVFIDNELVNCNLLLNGYVYLDVYKPFAKYDQFFKAEKTAIEKGIGLWDFAVTEKKTAEEYAKPIVFAAPDNTNKMVISENISGDKVLVSRVVDGDTIVVKFADSREEKVRLIGINTPETKHPSKSVEYFGKEASEYTKKHLENKTIELTYDQVKRDRFGRLLAFVWIDGVMFNQKIILDGYAYSYLKYPFNTKYMNSFRDAQRYAFIKNCGLWKNYAINTVPFKKPDPVYSGATNNTNTYSGSYNSSSSSSDSYKPSGVVHVKGYYRKDGTYVRPHTRSYPRRKK